MSGPNPNAGAVAGTFQSSPTFEMWIHNKSIPTNPEPNQPWKYLQLSSKVSTLPELKAAFARIRDKYLEYFVPNFEFVFIREGISPTWDPAGGYGLWVPCPFNDPEPEQQPLFDWETACECLMTGNDVSLENVYGLRFEKLSNSEQKMFCFFLDHDVPAT